LRLLGPVLSRGAVKPNSDKDQPSGNGNTDTSDPGVSAADDETPGPLVVGKVTDSNSPLLEDGGQEGALVVDEEVEDAVLVRQGEGSTEDGAVGSLRGDVESQAVERREHAELELNSIGRGWGVGLIVVHVVLGELNLVVLVAKRSVRYGKVI
jgi:hypothetical protein